MIMKFTDFLLEKYKLQENIINNDDIELLTQGKTAEADPHEILTAALCLTECDLSNISKESTYNSKISSIIEFIVKNKNKKIIGINETDETFFTNVYNKTAKSLDTIKLSFPAAVSAANSIKAYFGNNGTIKTVYLTGSTWPADVAKYKISKYGMDDYNSSDIIVFGKKDGSNIYLGVSLKKKEEPKYASPTLINKSVIGLIEHNETEIKNNTLSTELKDTINKWMIKVLKKNQENITTTLSKNPKNYIINTQISKKNQDEIVTHINEWFKDKEKILSNLFNKKNLTSAGRNVIRSVINKELSGKNSVYKKIIEFFNKSDNKDLSLKLANQMVELIFKPNLINFIEDNLKGTTYTEFDFALCTGIGNYKKLNNRKKTQSSDSDETKSSDSDILITVNQAEFHTVDTIYNILKSLAKGKKGNKLTAEFIFDIENRNLFDGNGPAKIFVNLNIGGTTIANLEIRYKGSFSASPQFFATISKEFKQELLKSENKN